MPGKPSPWAYGVSDATNGLPSSCPFKGHAAEDAYFRGYMTGKSLKDTPRASILSFPERQQNDNT